MLEGMLLAHAAFWLLLLWAKKDDEIGLGEAIAYAVIWCAALLLATLGLLSPIVAIVATVGLDIILLFRSGIVSAGAGRL